MTLAAVKPGTAGTGRIAADLVACGSLEMNADRAADAKAIAAQLPVGTRVYVNHLPRHSLAQSLDALVALKDAGLEPVPHIAARRVESAMALRRYLDRAVGEAGVAKALVIGGDTPQAGPYADAASLLASGLLAQAGIREVGFAGYPEGHASIPQARLAQALGEKLALARTQGMGAHVVTQFSFAPARIVEYCSELARQLPDVPVYVGLAGPTDPIRLLRYAQRCGVSASLRALRSQGFDAARLVTHTDPSDQIAALGRYCASHAACNVVGVHLFTFGGVAQAAAWMNQAITRLQPG